MDMEVIGTDEFTAWYGALSEAGAEAVTRAVNLLERLGTEQDHVAAVELYPRLGMSGALKLFELWVVGSPLRVLFALEDPERAVLLYGYDADTELRVGSPRQLPAVAHALLAANVYRLYRAAKSGAA